MEPDIETYRFNWSGYLIEVRYVADWLKSCRSWMPVSHIEVTTIDPPRVPLPITETGYKSHFLHPSVIDAEGGPEAYVRQWLNATAQSPDWQEQEAASRQMSLF